MNVSLTLIKHHQNKRMNLKPSSYTPKDDDFSNPSTNQHKNPNLFVKPKPNLSHQVIYHTKTSKNVGLGRPTSFLTNKTHQHPHPFSLFVTLGFPHLPLSSGYWPAYGLLPSEHLGVSGGFMGVPFLKRKGWSIWKKQTSMTKDTAPHFSNKKHNVFVCSTDWFKTSW